MPSSKYYYNLQIGIGTLDFFWGVFINSYLDRVGILQLKREFHQRNFHVNQSGVMPEVNDITVSLSV